MARSKKNSGTSKQDPIRALKNEIAGVGLICSGTLLERTKTCGKPNCRCANDPQARHGPYYEWSWREGGKLRHKIVPAEKADLVREAIQNHRTVKELLGRWERQSAAVIFGGSDRKSKPGKKIN
jgi:hypothetical protein